MAFSSANILAGPVRVEYDPTLAGAIGDAEGASPWISLGFTSEGLTFSAEHNVEPFHVDQVAVPVHAIFNSSRALAAINIAEMKFDALKVASPGASEKTPNPIPGPTDRYSVLGAGACDDDSLVPFRIRFLGTGPASTAWTLMFYRAIAIGNAEQSFTRTGVRMIPTEIEAQSDGTNSLWEIQEV